MRTIALICSTLAALAAGLALGQVRVQAGPDAPVEPALAAEVVEAAAAALEKSYVYEDVGRRMAATLRAKSQNGDYRAATTGRALARAIGEDCQAVQPDKHLKVFFRLPPGNGHGLPAFENGGYGKAEVLPGNVGYLEVVSFIPGGAEAERAAAQAMDRLAGTDALIVDLRRNGGGRPDSVAMLSSYLFDGKVHLNSLYWREGDRTDAFWTNAKVAGTRYGSRKPVFVLTSARTGSGAEEFGYNLQALKRATLVGETTAGAAHPVTMRTLPGEFAIAVPTGRAINPVTGKNWEGVGVVPDVAVPAAEALERARELAAKALARAS